MKNPTEVIAQHYELQPGEVPPTGSVQAAAQDVIDLLRGYEGSKRVIFVALENQILEALQNTYRRVSEDGNQALAMARLVTAVGNLLDEVAP